MTTEVTTTVPGNIWKILVKEGDQVKKGDTLFIMEIMKTEVNHDAPVNGKIVKVNIINDQEGVDPGTVVLTSVVIMYFSFLKSLIKKTNFHFF